MPKINIIRENGEMFHVKHSYLHNKNIQRTKKIKHGKIARQ
jgi:hypothetical protein